MFVTIFYHKLIPVKLFLNITNYFLLAQKTEGFLDLQFSSAQTDSTPFYMHTLHGHDNLLLSFHIPNPLNTKRVCFTYNSTQFTPHSKQCPPRLYKTNLLILYKAKSPFLLSSIHNT